MALAELASAEQYLHTNFEHDAEFVEGRIVERPVPTWEHACIQGFLVRELWEVGRRIVTQPPYLCIEILSPEDTAVETLDKVREYLSFGVKWVWVIDPVSRSGQIHSSDSVARAEDSIFSTDLFSVDLSRAEF